MASPNEVECCFGAQAILIRMDAAASHAQAVRDNRDVEAVHDMRVASRRLRTVLELFVDCLPGKKARTWRKAIRRVTRALGEARDTDVHVEFVEGFLKSVTDRRLLPGLKRLLLRLRQKRRALQDDMVAALDPLDSSGTLGEMEAILGPVLARGQLSRVDLNDPCIRRRASRAISQRLEAMLAYEPYIEQPQRILELHAMRIAAKHLRYAVEIFRPLYGEDFDSILRSLKQVQQQLGDLHDCDVWIAWLPSFVEQERQRTVEYFGDARTMGRLVPGIDHLRTKRQCHRDECYRDFVAFWQQLRQQDTWVAMYRMVSPQEQSEPPVPPPGQEPSA